ncbi:hypothetical protein Htur_4536 (plasmid) [Haloterrigena turkmenica DSM 5511]|uniref:Uncharacterized protein n=1 Tax=Haloterrigena turkmenica (strain ATCC 51198 / DSM 5511 / JCM 9101 / NCIMB 13204 / VKM B-1734 / 4k) TaxID=543526 RepID=D2S1U3_HALTV|nr:hypothetical protein [Haloterrigena turkmenica]ADB63340.1 hypothetical protein Htur_4536 [Haloterrigena turkmenica DSM 5511]
MCADGSGIDTDEQIDEDVSRSDLVHERLRESPIKRWILLDGSRYMITGLFSLIVFITCAGIGLAGYIPVTDPDTATTLVAAIVGGTLPFITIVLAINQLVLSQELGWPGDLEDRLEKMTAFRHEVETVTETPVSPAAPADFLQLIVDTVVARTKQLQVEASQMTNPSRTAVVKDFIEAVTTEGELVSESLEDADFGTFDALSAVLGRFNGAHLYAARKIRTRYADELSNSALETLDQLIELLGYLAIARQSFKTLYMQYELAHLSKLLLIVGFPTLLGGGIFMMVYPTIIETVGVPMLLVIIVSGVVTFVFLPFIVLLVYTFRIASIASRTADFGPFVPRVNFGEEREADEKRTE